MKSTIWLVAVLLGSLLCFGGAGCKKKVATSGAKTPEEAAFQLRVSLANTSPQAQNLYYDKVDPNVRYGRYQEALAALDQMSNDPSLKDDEHKKLITQLADMLKSKSATP